MRQSRSQAHTSVLALCVLGCLWVAGTDERLPDLPKPSITTEIQAASVETQEQAPADPEAAAPSAAPFGEPSPGPPWLRRLQGRTPGPVRSSLTP